MHFIIHMSTKKHMSDRSVVITGSGTGIGFTTANKLADMGWKVFAGILPNEDASIFGNHENITPVVMDITKDDMVKKAFDLVSKEVGEKGLAALINNAAIANIGTGALEGVPMEDVKFLFEVNVFGTIRVTQTFLPLLRKYGPAKIICMASGAVRVPVPFSAGYNMSKFAVEGMVKTLRFELAPFGIQVAAIEPTGVKTPMTDNNEENMEITWSRIPTHLQDIYRVTLGPTLDWLNGQIEDAVEPDVIADRIIEVLKKKKIKKARYGAGGVAPHFGKIVRIMGEKTFENILMKQFMLKKGEYMYKEWGEK